MFDTQPYKVCNRKLSEEISILFLGRFFGLSNCKSKVLYLNIQGVPITPPALILSTQNFFLFCINYKVFLNIFVLQIYSNMPFNHISAQLFLVIPSFCCFAVIHWNIAS